MSNQSIGTLLVATGLIMGAFCYIYNSTTLMKDNLFGEVSGFLAAGLVIVGCIMSIVYSPKDKR